MSMSPFVVLWGALATVLGACFIVFRRQVSRAARNWRAWRGYPVGQGTQSPTVIAVGGAVFLIAGPLVIVGVLTGVLRTH